MIVPPAISLLALIGCLLEEPQEDGPPPTPATFAPDPPLEQITDAKGWIIKRGSLRLSGPAGERTIALDPPMRLVDARATAWHLFLVTERGERGGDFGLEITDLSTGTTCGAALPSSAALATSGKIAVDVARNEHVLYRAQLADDSWNARLFDVECRELVNVSAQKMELSPDNAFLATYPTPGAVSIDAPVIRLFDLGVGVQLGGNYPVEYPAYVSQVAWKQDHAEFTMAGAPELPPVYIPIPP